MASELTGEQLTKEAGENGSFKDMGEFNEDVKNAVRGRETSHVLSGSEQKRVDLINGQVKRIQEFMRNIGYVIPNDERKGYMDIIEALQNGEIDEIPSDLLGKIEDREEKLKMDDGRE